MEPPPHDVLCDRFAGVAAEFRAILVAAGGKIVEDQRVILGFERYLRSVTIISP